MRGRTEPSQRLLLRATIVRVNGTRETSQPFEPHLNTALPHVQRSRVPRSRQPKAGRVGSLRMHVVCVYVVCSSSCSGGSPGGSSPRGGSGRPKSFDRSFSTCTQQLSSLCGFPVLETFQRECRRPTGSGGLRNLDEQIARPPLHRT